MQITKSFNCESKTGTFRRGRPFVCSAYRRSGTPPPRSSRTTAETSSAAGTRGTPAPQGAAPLPPPHKSSMVCRASVPTQQRPRWVFCPPYRNAGTMCVLCPSCPVGVWERVVEAGGGGGRACKRVVHVSLRLPNHTCTAVCHRRTAIHVTRQLHAL